MLYTIILINKNWLCSRNFTNTCSVSKSKKFMIDLPISISQLVVMLKTIDQHKLFLQKKKILSKTGFCQKCHEKIKGDMIVKENHGYWKCKEFKVKTSMKFRTIKYPSNIKLIGFILLAYCFTDQNQIHCQTSNKASLPQENYW